MGLKQLFAHDRHGLRSKGGISISREDLFEKKHFFKKQNAKTVEIVVKCMKFDRNSHKFHIFNGCKKNAYHNSAAGLLVEAELGVHARATHEDLNV